MEDGKWIQEATKQAKMHGETPIEFAQEVLKEPEHFTKRTRKRAQFAININPEKISNPVLEPKMEAPMEHKEEHHKKAKRAPSAWNLLVSKHVKEMGKGKFKEALAKAKEEYAHHKAGHKAEHHKAEHHEAPKEKKPRKPRAKKEHHEAPHHASKARKVDIII